IHDHTAHTRTRGSHGARRAIERRVDPGDLAGIKNDAGRRSAGPRRRLGADPPGADVAFQRERDRSADLRRDRVVDYVRSLPGVLASSVAGDQGRPDGCAPIRIVAMRPRKDLGTEKCRTEKWE